MATKGSGNNLSIFALLEAFRRRKLLIIVPALVLTAGFSVYAYRQPDRYKAQALIAAENLTPPEYLKHVAPEPLDIEHHLWTVREVLFSNELLDAAAHDLKEYKSVRGPLPQEAIDAVKPRITIKVESEHTFHVGFEGEDPQEVANVTNRLAGLFTERASQRRDQKTTDAKSAFDAQIETLKQRLEEQDKEMREYKQRAVNELPEHIDGNIKEVETFRAQYDDRTSKIADEEAKRTRIAKQIADLESQGVLKRPMIEEKTPQEAKLEELRITERAYLARGYTADHPELRATRREIRNVEAAIANGPVKRSDPSPAYMKYTELRSELESTDQRIDAYRREQARLSTQINGYQRRVDATPAHAQALAEMQREYHVRESQFHALLDKQLDANLAQTLQKSETGIAFAVVEPASVPAAPFSPQRERLILMGIAAGLGLGLGLAFLMEQNDTSFSTVDDFQSFTGVPVIGAVPAVPVLKNGPASEMLITTTDPDSVAAEQYRLLAMKVQQHCAATNSNVVMLTSAAGGEGKSTTAVNLAQALSSMADGPVLLIDGDMRKPRIHEYLNLKVFEGRGFYQLLLNGGAGYAKHVVKARQIHVIPGSPATGNPVAVLSSPKARNLFDQLRQDYRYIVVDAPPTLPVADSHLLAGICDKVLFVVRARKTPRELFQHAVESFDSVNVMGAVLNDVDYQRSRYAYAYEYYKKSA